MRLKVLRLGFGFFVRATLVSCLKKVIHVGFGHEKWKFDFIEKKQSEIIVSYKRYCFRVFTCWESNKMFFFYL